MGQVFSLRMIHGTASESYAVERGKPGVLVNDEMGAAVDASLGAADTILFGRKTYDSFAGAWPEREAAGAVHPIAVRKGMRLFDEGEPPIPFTLITSQTFETGVLNLVYAPAESAGNASYQDAKVHLPQPEQ
jgi:hypothetical protein